MITVFQAPDRAPVRYAAGEKFVLTDYGQGGQTLTVLADVQPDDKARVLAVFAPGHWTRAEFQP